MLRPEDECIVVDDCSTDDSVSLLNKKYPSVHVVRHTKNFRYAASCNDGVREAKHDIVLLLNNDVSPEEDVLRHLLIHFEDAYVFAVGCAEKNEQGVWSGRSSAVFRHGLIIHQRADEQRSGSTLWASGGSMMVRRSLYLKIGGMDTLFHPAYEEDRDLSYRAIKMGYRVLFDEHARVFHDHQTTNVSVFGERSMRLASRRNSLLFLWKNLTDRDLVLSHLFWLPYHILIDSIRTNGEFGVAFFQALLKLPIALIRRNAHSKMWRLSDREVLHAGHD